MEERAAVKLEVSKLAIEAGFAAFYRFTEDDILELINDIRGEEKGLLMSTKRGEYQRWVGVLLR